MGTGAAHCFRTISAAGGVSGGEGGTHDPDERVLLCSQHHDAAHRGAVLVRGTFRAGFQFSHADGRGYGSAEVDAGRAEVMRDAFEALRGLLKEATEANGS